MQRLIINLETGDMFTTDEVFNLDECVTLEPDRDTTNLVQLANGVVSRRGADGKLTQKAKLIELLTSSVSAEHTAARVFELFGMKTPAIDVKPGDRVVLPQGATFVNSKGERRPVGLTRGSPVAVYVMPYRDKDSNVVVSLTPDGARPYAVAADQIERKFDS